MSHESQKVRLQHLRAIKDEGRKIVMVTATDAITGEWAEAAGVDVVLVGDSLGMATLGLPTTIQVTLDMMIHHCAAVARAVVRPMLVGDMPFMTYKIGAEQALASCGRLMQEGGVEAVKLEGGAEVAGIVARLVGAGIPVMGHIGLLPQSVHALGGYRLQGRDEAAAERLLDDARRLQDAGVFALVLEKVTAPLAARITRELTIPTIGIGSGRECDGQVLVLADLLGMTAAPPPKLAKAYAHLGQAARQAIEQYGEDVRTGKFPGEENIYS